MSIGTASRFAAWIGASIVAGGAAHAQPQHAGQYEQADIEYGARLYLGRCIICHGERGDGMPGVNLRSGRFKNASTDRELSNVVRDGVAGTAMAPNAYATPRSRRSSRICATSAATTRTQRHARRCGARAPDCFGQG